VLPSVMPKGVEHKLAFSTNAYLKFSFADSVRRLARIGYAGVEIMADVPHAYPAKFDSRQRSELSRSLASRGLAVSNVNAFTHFADGGTFDQIYRPRR